MDETQKTYCDEVLRFRKVLNLTSIKDINVFYTTFIDPSIALSKWITKGSIVLDIGSGMGIPGIPLLIHREDISGILVERRKKRTEFIRHVIRKFHLKAKAFDADIHDLEPLKATVCVARAVSDVKTLISMCDKHIIEGGTAVLSVPNETLLPSIDGWDVISDSKSEGLQRITCYKKDKFGKGGVSRET